MKSYDRFRTGRTTFASIVMLRRFQSSDRIPGGGGISSGSGVGSVTGAPPRPAPTIEKPPRPGAGFGSGGGATRRNGAAGRSGSRLIMRPSESSVTRYVLRSPSASETYTPVMPASVFCSLNSTPAWHGPEQRKRVKKLTSWYDLPSTSQPPWLVFGRPTISPDCACQSTDPIVVHPFRLEPLKVVSGVNSLAGP